MSRLALSATTRSAIRPEAGWWRALGLALLALLMDVVIALAVVDSRFAKLVLLGLAAMGLVLVFRFPFAAACAVVMLTTTVLDPGRWKLPVGPTELRLEELILGALLIVAVLRPRRSWWGGVAGGALAVFFALLAAAFSLTVVSGRAAFSDAFGYSRLFAPLLLFFVIVRLFPEPAQALRVVSVAAILAALAGVVAVLAAAPGSAVASFLNPSGDASIRDSEGFGLVNRVRLPGVYLAYALFWFAAARAATVRGSGRFGWTLVVAGMGIGLALSFNRNMWLGVVLGLGLMLVLSRLRTRRHFLAAVAVLVAGGAGFVVSGAQVSESSPLYPIVERGTSLTDPREQAKSSSLQDRALENRFAFRTLERYPVTGVGPGAPYGLTGTDLTAGGTFVRVEARFMHNQYVHLLLIGGPAMLAAYLTFLGIPTLRGLTQASEDDAARALAIGLAIVLVSAIVTIFFVDATGSAVVALLAGTLTVITGRRPAAVPPTGATA